MTRRRMKAPKPMPLCRQDSVAAVMQYPLMTKNTMTAK